MQPVALDSPNGLDAVARALLLTLRQLDAAPGGVGCVRSTRVLEVALAHGAPPAYAYDCLSTLGQPWWTTLSPFARHGNFGSPDDPPADAHYTEVGLSELGVVAAAAEAGEGAPLPLGLVMGDAHAGGRRPPFAADQVVDALLRLHRGGAQAEEEAQHALGKPHFPTCEVAGAIDDLLVGERAVLVLTAPTAVDPTNSRGVRITGFAPSVGIFDTAEAIAQAAKTARRPDDGWARSGPVVDSDENRYRDRSGPLPLSGIRNMTRRGEWLLEIKIQAEADADDVVDQLRKLWPVRLAMQADLGQPWADAANGWLDAFAANNPMGVDLEAHLRQHLPSSLP